MIGGGMTGGLGVSFESSPAPATSQVREIKLCDDCGRNFLRIRGLGLRNCQPCTDRIAARELASAQQMEKFIAEQNERQRLRDQAPMDKRERLRAYNRIYMAKMRAERALSLRAVDPA